jgi:hypothetical protein
MQWWMHNGLNVEEKVIVFALSKDNTRLSKEPIILNVLEILKRNLN